MQEIHLEIEGIAMNCAATEKCDLNIGAPSFLHICFLPINAFKIEYPGIAIKMIESNDSDLCKFQGRNGGSGFSVEPTMPSNFKSFVLKKRISSLAVPSTPAINRSSYPMPLDMKICAGRFLMPETWGYRWNGLQKRISCF